MIDSSDLDLTALKLGSVFLSLAGAMCGITSQIFTSPPELQKATRGTGIIRSVKRTVIQGIAGVTAV